MCRRARVSTALTRDACPPTKCPRGRGCAKVDGMALAGTERGGEASGRHHEP